MRGSTGPTACSLLLAATSVWAAPTSRPAPPDPAVVNRLVRQLDNPVFSKRQDAAKALATLGPSILPVLEKAEPSASFETKTTLAQIIHILRDLLRGVIVYRVVPGSEADRAGIKPGDVIVRVQNQPITDCVNYLQVVADDLRDPQPYLLRSGGLLHEVSVTPRRLGVALADYEERFGAPLVDAIQAYHDQRMAEARDGFLEAQRAGLAFSDRDELLPMFALATYHAGDAFSARKLLDDLAESVPNHDPWEWFHELLPSMTPISTHLQLHVSRRRFAAEPGSFGMAMDYAGRLCEMNQFSEGIFGVMHAEHQASDDYEEAMSWNKLLSAFDVLDLEPEAMDAVARLTRTESRPAMWMSAAAIAERLGRYDQAADVARRLAERAQQAGRSDPDAWAEVIRLELLAGEEAQTAKTIRELPPLACASILQRLQPAQYRWVAARLVFVELARRGAQYENAGPLALSRAFQVFARQEQPRPPELRSLFNRYATRSLGGQSQPGAQEREELITLALADGDLSEARRLTAQKDAAGSAALIDAIQFLTDRKDLTGERSPWRRVCGSWTLSGGDRLLLTSDDRLGVLSADGKIIREISPPEPRWVSAMLDPLVLVSPRDKRVLTISNQSLYRLDQEHSSWEKIARLTTGNSPRLLMLGSLLDDLLPALQADGGGPVEIVWPPALAQTNQSLLSLMLSDGTWLICDAAHGRVWRPRRDAQQMLKHAVDIYEVSPINRDLTQFYLFTSRGLLRWQPATGKVVEMLQPALDKPLSVVPVSEGITLPEGQIRFGLLPDDGGTTFIVDQKTDQIRREGCMNEVIPATYWKQMPARSRRVLVTQPLAGTRTDPPEEASQPAPGQG